MPADGQQHEIIVARLRPHARALFWPSIALIAVSAATGYFYGRFTVAWENTGILIGAALGILLLFLLPLFSWLGRNYTITSRRIVLRSGFLVRVRQELLHSRGYDVTVRKTSLQSLFGSGDVLINTGLDRPVVLRDVPGANLVQSAIHELMDETRNAVAGRRQADAARPPDETTAWGVR